MKFTKWLLAFSVAFRASFIASFAADAPTKLYDMESSFKSIPSCSFKYTIKTGLSERTINFVYSQGRYSFTENDPSTGSLKQALAYDGTQYYAVYEGDYLVTSSRSDVFGNYYRSWFAYNPLLNPYSVFFDKNNSYLGIPQLFDPRAWNLNLEDAKDVQFDGNTYSSVHQVSDSQDLTIGFRDSALPELAQGTCGDFQELWKVAAFCGKSIAGSNLRIPSKILCKYTTPEGTNSPYSYQITLDEASFKTFATPLPAAAFEIPVGGMSEVYDYDLDAKITVPKPAKAQQ